MRPSPVPILLAVLLLLLLPSSPLPAQTGNGAAHGDRTPVRAVRAQGPVVLDGRLDEAAWAAAPVVSDFTQVDPREGEPVSEPTEARIVFDEEALYIGVRASDRGPVTARIGRRDMPLGDSDWFGVVIDAYHDHRTGFVFDVNPAGVQRDAVKSVTGGGEADDNSWDAVWDVATSVDDGGWTAEYRIPFSQLRFNESDAPVWGIQLERVIGRNREYAVTSFTPKSEAGGIPTYGHLEGLESVTAGQRLELLPYAVARGEFVDPGTDPFGSDAEGSASAGLDLRYRITSDLTLNASVNPDFGQVELDPAVINLGVYETFFEEKRPFFVEGSEIFDFGRNTSGGTLFYSRRIGRAPQLGAPVLEAEAADVTTILGAAKLSGKTAGGWSLGLIEAVTDRERLRFLEEGEVLDAEVEPLTNYLVARARRDLREGRTSVGGMLTAVHRDTGDGRVAGALHSSAWAGGVDFRRESEARDWVVRGSAAFSRVAGSPGALTRTQRAGNHFFQRPDAGHLEVDPDATSMSGYSVGMAVERQGGEHWRGELAVAATSPDFEVNDLGFQTRTDRRDVAGTLTWVENQPGPLLRDYRVIGQVRYEHNYDWQRILGFQVLGLDFRTLGFWGGHLRLTRQTSAYDDRSTRGGPLIERPANLSGFFALGTDARKAVRVGVNVGGARDAYEGREVNGGLTLDFRPSDRWTLSLGPQVRRSRGGLQYVGTIPDPEAGATYGSRYLFAPLAQTTVSMETRLNVNLTPRLTLETYAQPFISTGDYGDVMELLAPGTYRFGSFEGEAPDLDFSFRSLRGNAVLRWEWRAGSTLFLAWQQTRSDRIGVALDSRAGDFDFSRDRQALFRAPPDNIFVLKVNYWLTP